MGLTIYIKFIQRLSSKLLATCRVSGLELFLDVTDGFELGSKKLLAQPHIEASA